MLKILLTIAFNGYKRLKHTRRITGAAITISRIKLFNRDIAIDTNVVFRKGL